MSVARSALVRGPANVTWNGITMWSQSDIHVPLEPVWNPVMTSMYSRVDRSRGDLVIRVGFRLWGAWENLSVLFPSSLLNPTIGASVYGTGSDLPLVLTARNGDQVTIVNAQLTKVADLFLGPDQDLFSANVEFTGIIAAGANPEDAGSYYTTAVSQTFTETNFSKANFKRVRFSGAWGAKAGYTAIIPQKGVAINWEITLAPCPAEGLTRDMSIALFEGSAKCIPIGPTIAQLKTESKIEVAQGTLLGGNVADLVWTGAGSGPVITLKNAGMIAHGLDFGVEPLRNAETTWVTTRGFTAGVPNAVATAA
jgi:hypothetical protein